MDKSDTGSHSVTALKCVLYRFLSVSMYLDSTEGRSSLRRVLGMSRLTVNPPVL